MSNEEIQRRLDFLRQAEALKDTLRSAHTSQGRTESVADHSWRLTLLIISFADQFQEIDLLHLLKMCILHDLGEAIDGDIPAPEQIQSAGKAEKERVDFQMVIADLPKHLRSEFLSIWDEYEAGSSREAKLAKALDKIETILQHNQGKNPDNFDYAFNLDYGERYTSAIPLAKKIRSILDEETAGKIG